MRNTRLRLAAHAGMRFFNSDDGAGVGGGGGAGAGKGPEGSGADDGDKGFPANTPVKDMTDAQQAAYWKDKSRKHEGRVNAMSDYDEMKQKAAELDQLKDAEKSADQKAVDDAVKQALAAKETEWAQKLAATKVAAELRALLHMKTPEDMAAIIEPLNLSNFLTSDGEVDTDKVTQYASKFTTGDEKGGRWPGIGQGNRGSTKTPKGVSAGRDMYAERHGKNK